MIKTKQELLNHFSDINKMYNNPIMYQTLSNMIDELLEQVKKETYIQGYDYGVKDWFKSESQPCEDMGEVSDGYHTFNQLYHQRAVLFATIVNQNKDKSWKSFKHSDGNYCFDSNGKWFIVGIDTPQGSYTYHYAKEYWDMFDCQELECGKEWDGHTEEDVTRLLSLEQQPKTGHWICHIDHCEDLGVIPSGLGAYEWCSNCDCGIDIREWQRNPHNYCPNCGAKMESEERE